MADLTWIESAFDELMAKDAVIDQLTRRVSALENGGVADPFSAEQAEAMITSMVSAISPMAFNPRGVYDPAQAYVKPDVVIGTDGNTYTCKAEDAVTGVDPVTDKSAWEILVERGAPGQTGATGQTGAKGEPGQTAIANIITMGYYNPNTTYMKDQSVIAADGNTYGCLKDGTVGVEPVHDADPANTASTHSWGLLVLRGAQGPAGPAGKDAPAASITAAALAPELAKEIGDAAKLVAGANPGNWGEIATNRYFRGKMIYCQDFSWGFNAAAGQTADAPLKNVPNYVDRIISVGGDWDIGYNGERHQIGQNDGGAQSSEVFITTGGILTLRTKASNARSNAMAYVTVEYTKK